MSKDEIKEWWDLREPFKTEDDIPDIPVFKSPEDYNEIVVKNLIRCGAIPKENLESGSEYIGSCRNSDIATWDGELEKFIYTRNKFGSSYKEYINHFQDDDGYDVFVPFKKK